MAEINPAIIEIIMKEYFFIIKIRQWIRKEYIRDEIIVNRK